MTEFERIHPAERLLAETLGISPATLRGRLLWGERVERSLVLTDDPLFVVTDEGQMTQSATWFRASLTRPDHTDSVGGAS